ncbi:MAG: prolipoprotein diacylglyceryl transferase [Chthonomonas sp.]|nr:prolipoprotein diacylglyceryl transferase [Chthonomonas sp.]
MIPVFFKIGSFEVRSYGVMLILAVAAGVWWGSKRLTAAGFPGQKLLDGTPWLLIPGALGARIMFIAQEWGYYREHPHELWSLKFDGLTSFGGFLFGALGLIYYCRRIKLPVMRALDALAAPLLMANAVGRVGCLLNGCCFGVATQSWIGIRFATEPRYHHHPAQSYESAINLGLMALLLLWERRGTLRPGQASGISLVLLGLGRFIYEFWRAGTREEVAQGIASSTKIPGWPITEAHLAAVMIMFIGCTLAIVCGRARTTENSVKNSPK